MQSLDDSTTSLLLLLSADVDVDDVGGETQDPPLGSERRGIRGAGARGRGARCHGVTVADVVICAYGNSTSFWIFLSSMPPRTAPV